MLEEVVLATYSEIALKSKPVRIRLRRMLARNIRSLLKLNGIEDIQVELIEGRLLLRNNPSQQVVEITSKVFGVYSSMQALEIPSTKESIINAGIEIAKQDLTDNDKFAIRARRIGNHTFSSREIEVELGKEILDQFANLNLQVDLSNPKTTIYVEVRRERTYVYSKIFSGPGGLPYGSQGKLISLFSGGIDSPVATWMMMKRGADVIPLFLDQRPFVGEDYFKRFFDVARKIREYVPKRRFRLLVTPMGKIMEAIVNGSPKKLRCVLCKRTMYRIGCELSKKYHCEGLVTGESLGQVASQTLFNLRIIDLACNLPIHRPLIGFEKNDNVEIARRIQTFDVSTSKVQECTAVPTQPTTKAKKDEVFRVEGEINISDFIEDAIRKTYSVFL